TPVSDARKRALDGLRPETAGQMTGPSVIADAIFEELRPRLGDAIDGDKIVARATAAAREVVTSVLAHGVKEAARVAREAAAEAVHAAGALPIEIRVPGAPPKDIGRQHKMFPRLLAVMATRTPVWLVGPAGSGKTVSVGVAADALELAFYPKSMGPATTEHAVIGHNGPDGTYVPGILHKPYTEGGVMLWDEIDAAHPAALTTLNAAISNDQYSFPHKTETRHADCVMVAAANTIGRGADRQYVGRVQLDAATLDRFAIIEWGYDEGFETALAAGYADAAPKHGLAIRGWCLRVQALRASAERLDVRLVFSTRAIANGARLLIGGLSLDEVEEMLLWNGADVDTAKKVRQGVQS
ncbi:hypothetical protein LCGC14_2324670, partial [marine sediment metagenome]